MRVLNSKDTITKMNIKIYKKIVMNKIMIMMMMLTDQENIFMTIQSTPINMNPLNQLSLRTKQFKTQ